MGALKVGFVLASRSHEALASTRISVLNMLPFLRAAGVEPSIVFEPESGTETPEVGNLAVTAAQQSLDVVYFQKVHGASVIAQARELSRGGIRTIFGVCDLVEPSMVEATDATIVVTDFLRSRYPRALRPRIFVVHDGIERPDVFKQTWTSKAGSRSDPIRAILITSHALRALPLIGTPPAWLNVSIVGRYPPSRARIQRLRNVGWALRTMQPSQRRQYLAFMCSRHIERLAWTADGVYDEMLRADVGIIPIETESSDQELGALPGWELKSENRLTLMMSAGLPVVASSIPSYEHVVDHRRNAFLARSRRDFMEALECLRDPTLRREMGTRARLAVHDAYSMRRQAELLLEVLRSVSERGG